MTTDTTWERGVVRNHGCGRDAVRGRRLDIVFGCDLCAGAGRCGWPPARVRDASHERRAEREDKLRVATNDVGAGCRARPLARA